MLDGAVTIRGPHEAFAVRGKHRESVESGIVGDSFEPGAIFIDDIEIEAGGIFCIGHVRGEDDALAVRQPIRSEIRSAIVGDLMFAGAVCVHHPDFQIAGTNQAARIEIFVVGDLLGRLRMLRAVDDLFSVIGPERAAVVTQFVRELLHVCAVGIHGEDIEVAVTRGGENDVLAVARDGGFRVIAVRGCEWAEAAAIRLRRVDRVGVVNRPNIPQRIIGRRRARGIRGEGGGIKHAVAGRKEIAAGRAAFAVAEHLWSGGLTVGSVDGDRENLIAGDVRSDRAMRGGIEKLSLMLEGKIFVIGGEVGFGALSAESKLANIGEMLFAGVLQSVGICVGRFFALRCLPGSAAHSQSEKQSGSQEQRWADHSPINFAHRFHLGDPSQYGPTPHIFLQVLILKVKSFRAFNNLHKTQRIRKREMPYETKEGGFYMTIA